MGREAALPSAATVFGALAGLKDRAPRGPLGAIHDPSSGRGLAGRVRSRQNGGMTTPSRRAARARGRAGRPVLVLVAAAFVAVHAARAAAAEPDAHLFAAEALALRAAGVAGDGAAARVLAVMPGAGMAGDAEALSVLWRPFFANAIVALGRLHSPAPAALYYNPLLDVAALIRWEREGGAWRVASARALPGERLNGPEAAPALAPSWMAAKDPMEALALAAAARLDAFRRAHPAPETRAGPRGPTFAAAAADMRAVLPRLAWNAARAARWSGGAYPWLGPALAEVDRALASRDPAALTAAAPDTDGATAAALAGLPPGFAAGLALDMVLEAGGGGRLLIGSLPEDGDVYVLVLCRMALTLAGNACALRRFVLTSLSG